MKTTKRRSYTIVLLFAVVLLFVAGNIMAQGGPIAHFSIWKPRTGQEKNFDNGYRQHLKWHRSNGDKWSWYGWYFITGPRDGQFIDATFGHAWGDFDKSVKPAEDQADNELHTYPFGDFLEGYNARYLADLSLSDSNSLRSRFLRLLTLKVSDVGAGKAVIGKLKTLYQSKAGISTFLTYKIVDGGSLDQFFLLIGFNSFAEYEGGENLQEELSSAEHSLNLKAITSCTSETLVYRADMSLLP